MKRHPLANTYARALLAIGQERSEAEQYSDQLGAIRDAFADASSRVFLESPKISREDKKVTLRKVFEGKVSEAVFNLLLVLVDRNRQVILDQIADAYKDLCDEAIGRVHVHVTTATEMDSESLAQLTALLGKKLGKDIVVDRKVTEDLLGGMTIRVGDTVVDGSVRSRLNEIRAAFATRRLGSDLIDEN